MAITSRTGQTKPAGVRERCGDNPRSEAVSPGTFEDARSRQEDLLCGRKTGSMKPCGDPLHRISSSSQRVVRACRCQFVVASNRAVFRIEQRCTVSVDGLTRRPAADRRSHSRVSCSSRMLWSEPGSADGDARKAPQSLRRGEGGHEEATQGRAPPRWGARWRGWDRREAKVVTIQA